MTNTPRTLILKLLNQPVDEPLTDDQILDLLLPEPPPLPPLPEADAPAPRPVPVAPAASSTPALDVAAFYGVAKIPGSDLSWAWNRYRDARRPVTLERLARHMGIGRAALTNALRKVVGEPFNEVCAARRPGGRQYRRSGL